MNTARVLLLIVANRDCKLRRFDETNVFVHTELKEEYMQSTRLLKGVWGQISLSIEEKSLLFETITRGMV